ncbi:MAG TPA: ATP-binding cassette domain-containing protein, partial [Chitinophagaceae bacterium]|nr:ATP-binding cassette domain-containing protein [Chitinophagaceae bacterium]
RKKALEKLVIEEIKPSNRKYPGIIFKPDRAVGNDILKVHKLSAAIEGTPLFADVNFEIGKNDKVLFVSKNQLAVHAFFDIINGEQTADAGDFEWGTTITKAYLPNNNQKFFENDLNLMDWLRQFVPETVKDADEDFLRGFFGKMLFNGDELNKKTKVLSGGEKVRCMISRMMLQNPNCIILDEPTNHLDLESITAFNNGAIDFPGVVLMATHDQAFADSVCNRIIELTPRGVIDRICNYEEYLDNDRVHELRLEMYA